MRLAALLLAACTTERPPVTPATVLAYSSPMWYEETGRYFQPSPDGKWVIYGTGPLARLYDASTGMVDFVQWHRGMDLVRGGAFEPNGVLARTGVMGADTGWFADSAGKLVNLEVPAAALPRWSPAGTRVAFFFLGDSGITLGASRSKGGARIELDGAVNGLSWTPDGDALFAMVLHPDGLSSFERIATSGDVVIVRRGLDASPFFNSIAFSRDGGTAYLALAGDSAPDPKVRHDPEAPHRDLGIWALDVGTGVLHEVVTDPGDDFAPYIANGMLWLTHNEPKPEVVVMPVAGGAAHAVAEHGFLPRWSPDGRKIAFTRAYYRQSDYGLDMDGWIVGVDSAGEVTAPAKAWITGYGEDMGPVWSPNGKWVAFHSHRSKDPVPLYESPGRTDDIWLELASGGPEIRVTDFGFEVGPPDWSPDGRHLLFDSWVHGGVPRFAVPWIVTIDPRTGRTLGAKRMPMPAGMKGVTGEAWSPNAKNNEIALIERIDDDHRAIWLVHPDGSGARKLVEYRSWTIAGVCFSPDGETIYYSALAGDHMQLFATPRAGGAPTQLTHDSANLMHPSVSPDGKWMAASRVRWRKELRRMALP